MKTTILCCCLAMLLTIAGCSVSELATPPSNTDTTAIDFAADIQVSDLVGDWKVDVDGETVLANIAGTKPSALIFTTEVGAKASGVIQGDRIVIPEWRVTGQLSSDRKNIRWTNGICWNK